MRHFLGVWTIRCSECEQRFWGLGCERMLFKHLRHILNGDCRDTAHARWKGSY